MFKQIGVCKLSLWLNLHRECHKEQHIIRDSELFRFIRCGRHGQIYVMGELGKVVL